MLLLQQSGMRGQIAWLSSKGCDVSRDEKMELFYAVLGGAKATAWKIEDLYKRQHKIWIVDSTKLFLFIFHTKSPISAHF